MSKGVYLLCAIAAMFVGTVTNYSLVSEGQGGSRSHGGGGFVGGYSGGHK